MDDHMIEDRVRRAFAVIADEVGHPGPQKRWGKKRFVLGGVGALAAAAICLGLVLATGPDDASNKPRTDLVAAARVLDRLDAQTEVQQRWMPKTLAQALPNQPLRMPDGKERPASAAVVSGTVISAAPGAGYVQPPESDGASPVEVPFDSPSADFVVVRLTIKVDDAVGLDDDTIDVGMRFVGSPHLSTAESTEIVSGLRGLGDVLLVLSNQGEFALDPRLYRIAGETLLGLVGPDGRVTMADQRRQDSSFVQNLTTVNEVMREARLPARPAIPMF